MKILLEASCHIEDRRAATSRDKPSLLVQETCHHCGSEFVYIVADGDASEVTDLCARCKRQAMTLSVYDNVDLLERHHVWSAEEAEERLRDVTVGRDAVLRAGFGPTHVGPPRDKCWHFQDGWWRPIG